MPKLTPQELLDLKAAWQEAEDSGDEEAADRACAIYWAARSGRSRDAARP